MQDAGSGAKPEPRKPRRSPAVHAARRAVDFATAAGRLKLTVRSGWVQHGVPGAESVADHSHRVALLALAGAAVEGLDGSLAAAIAVVHDLAEASVGDITPRDGVPSAMKEELERDALDGMCLRLADGGPGLAEAAASVRAMWGAYAAAASPEARLVKDCDKIEMCLQALEYEVEADERCLDQFIDCVTPARLHTAFAKACLADIHR
ncbi:hypothetical protein FNF27_06289 [Cafeteria roenbergensis]|uniref:5'-deoxynucleotidase n=1 Tax=Cafeteria roenbergensis TaxID=33653 RepID=A0A5A8D966_CAFRO|nr:hypothetical protein FNF29_07245 [Cafeteria roenbergensis]KAA0162112.1 hypothetical protein FNF28_04816 [Cafeteria roenbergensis]KAA0167087.1 hypothetical protein FNF31_00973 [Cafeteria roenbergensis]KAA0171579.1 hypothetical protein FNF27_06289 [Cafeteria roenbergensis]|eukprot:KAA0147598.1 hypothetical protein FNF29_07245 [Cafeteria roenbergensis]